MQRKGNQKQTHYKPRHFRRYADAVEPRCTPIPEDDVYEPRHSLEESESESESEPRQDPIPSDLLEMGAYYNDHGFPIIPSSEGPPVIPEEVDDP